MEKGLEHLLHLLDGKDGEMSWQGMMERSTSNMTYQAWRHEPEVRQCKTIFEDATPELVRDFFWDDEFRTKWDPMLTHVKILEEDPDTGTMIVHWIKKGVTYPRRVDLYFSSWVIKPVPSRKVDGSECEVTLIHYEDMGIPKDVARLGVRHGTVKKLHAGFRTYQNAHKLDPTPSRCALMARITANIPNYETREQILGEDERTELVVNERHGDGIDWRLVAVGGAVFLGVGHRIAQRRGNPTR